MRKESIGPKERNERNAEVDNVTLNIDRYLDELEKSIDDKQNYTGRNPHRLSSDTSEIFTSTSGEETSANLSSTNSRRLMLSNKRPSILNRASTPQPIMLDNAPLPPFIHPNHLPSVHALVASNTTLGTSQTVLLASGSNSSTSSAADGLGSNASSNNHINAGGLHAVTSIPSSIPSSFQSARTRRMDDEEAITDNSGPSSIHFATPFEFSNKVSRRTLDRKPSLNVRLVWRNLTYRTSGNTYNNKRTATIPPTTVQNISKDSDHHYRSKGANSGHSGKNGNENLSSSGKRKLILDRQSGDIQGGQLSAIIGPSGAGKSTLLECLAGRRTLRLSGQVYLEYPTEYLPNGQRMRISFIAQKDVVIGVLTVRETLMFASKLKNYKLIRNSHYHARLVNALLAELQLDKCAEIASSKISGGQLKRLSFALELISGPDVLLLDEPTSGLDSSSAGATIQLLRRLTDLRRASPPASAWRYKPPAILCSIHQPSASVLKLFHRIYVLSSDGRCVYHDTPDRLMSHLARFDLHCPSYHNPADFLVEIASGDHGQQAINQLAKHCRLASEHHPDDRLDETGNSGDYDNEEESYDEFEIDNRDKRSGRRRSPESNRPSGAGKHPRRRRATSKSYAPSETITSGRSKRVKVTKVLEQMKQQRFPLWNHFWLLLQRTYLTTSRDPKLTWFRILQALFIGGVMAFLYDYPIGEQDSCILDSRPPSNSTTVEDDAGNALNSRTQDNIAFIFFITLFTVMASMMPTVLTFPAEVAVLIQERNNGWYSCWTYYWTKIIADTPYQLVITITFCSIVYPATGQPWVWWRFALFNLISVLVAMIAQSVGILFGTIYVRSVETAVFMAPLSMAPVFLLSGFFAKVSKLPWFLKPIAFVSYVRYAFEAFLITIYGLGRCEDVPLFFDASGNTNGIGSLSEDGDSDSRTPSNTVEYAENRAQLRFARAFKSRADELFQRVPTYAAEFPKVWSGFYNPVAYAQTMEQRNLFGSSIGTTSGEGTNVDGGNEDVPPDAFGHLDQTGNNNHTGGSSSSLLDANKAFPTGSFVLNHFELEDAHLWENLLILISILFLLRIVGYILLIYKTNQRR